MTELHPQPAAAQILVVDDQPAFLEQIRFFLELEGFAITTAENGEAALEEFENGLVPDLILADVMMPKMSGFEFFRATRQRPELERIPFIFVSARDRDEEDEDLSDLSSENYIRKPFDPNDLVRLIRFQLGLAEQS